MYRMRMIHNNPERSSSQKMLSRQSTEGVPQCRRNGTIFLTQKESAVIGAGSFLTDCNLGPNEVASRDRVMYVEPSNYDPIVLTISVIEAGNPGFDADFKLQRDPRGEYDLVPIRQ